MNTPIIINWVQTPVTLSPRPARINGFLKFRLFWYCQLSVRRTYPPTAANDTRAYADRPTARDPCPRVLRLNASHCPLPSYAHSELSGACRTPSSPHKTLCRVYLPYTIRNQGQPPPHKCHGSAGTRHPIPAPGLIAHFLESHCGIILESRHQKASDEGDSSKNLRIGRGPFGKRIFLFENWTERCKFPRKTVSLRREHEITSPCYTLYFFPNPNYLCNSSLPMLRRKSTDQESEYTNI